MNYLKSSLLALAVVLMAASQASAAPIVFNLNCTFTGTAIDGSCTSGASWGTVTLTDSGNFLNIVADLTNPWLVVGLYLNVPTTWTIGTTNQKVVIGGTEYTWEEEPGSDINSVAFETNNQGTGNYLYLDFGIRSDKNVDPWTGNIGLYSGSKPGPITYRDLDPSDFFQITDDAGAAAPGNTALVYLAANIKNDPASPTVTQLVGSTQVIPEPASLLLFGSGLSALGVHARRRLRRNRG